MRAATARYLAAHEALWRHSADEHDAGICWETDEGTRLNRAAHEASENVARWRQALLDRRLLRKLFREGFAWCDCGGALVGPGHQIPVICE